MDQKTKTSKPKVGRPPKPGRKTARISVAAPWEMDSQLAREADLNGVSKSEAFCRRVELTLDIDPAVLNTLSKLSGKLAFAPRVLMATAVDVYLSYRMGVCRILPPGAVQYPEFRYDSDGLIIGPRRIAFLTEDFAKRERLLWYAIFSLIPEEERTEEQEGYLQAVREDVALMKEIESAMEFSPKET